jgi:glycosyltransferase involved in cell wall biosynthesis
MKKILILCPYPQNAAAGQRFKYEQYISSWKNNGYSVEVSSFFNKKTWDILYEESNIFNKAIGTIRGYLLRLKYLFLLRQYDVVYIFMWVTPLGTSLFERLVRKLSKNIVYDFDDSVFLKEEVPKSMNLSLSGVANKSLYLISSADRVILSSPYNLEFCVDTNVNSQAVYIPCSINTERFKKREEAPKDHKIVIGWTGTFSSIPYIDSIKDALIELYQENPFKLLLITNFNYSFPEVDLEVVRWDVESEIEQLQRIDIGIYPVTLDQWTLGKGGLKVIQYMSIGIPSVATNHGTACDIIENGVNGFLVDSQQEWIESLKKLMDDLELRKIIGNSARMHAEANYSLKSVESKYLKVLDSLK